MKKIIVKDGKRHTYKYKLWLIDHGYKFKKTGKYTCLWEKTAEDDIISRDIKYLKRKKLQIQIIDDIVLRSNDYRKQFFKTHKGMFGSDYYICAYCGKVQSKKKITVDHLFPISKAQKSKIITWIIKTSNFESINDTRNLIPACRRCNSQKSDKGGFWLIWGWLGKHYIFWYLLWFLLLTVVVLSVLYILK